MKKDMRNLEGKTCIFSTQGTDSEWKQYDGMKCVVLNRVKENRYDFHDVGTMWEIRLENGNELDAFADELTLI